MESYLHKRAKELIYKEIEEKSGFEWKSNNSSGFESLISREDHRGECVLMEFPTKEGYYPDEFGCEEYIDNERYAKPEKKDGYRFNNGHGCCRCSECEYFNFKDSVVHDVAAFWKGNVRWAIEIVNKHEPDWIEVYASMPYPIYFVRAEDVLKRVGSTPSFVYKVVWTSDPK